MKQRAADRVAGAGRAGTLLCAAVSQADSALQPDSLPWSTDSGQDGQLAVWRWLQAEHVPVLSLRQRYDRLSIAGYRRRGDRQPADHGDAAPAGGARG
jgi:hypothetical protein